MHRRSASNIIFRHSWVFIASFLVVAQPFQQATAGYVVVMADSTPAFSLEYDFGSPFGVRTFFRNLLGGGDSALVLEPSNSGYADLANDFYNRITGVTSKVLYHVPTDANLDGVDLIVATNPIHDFTAGDAAVIGRFLARGGSLLLMVEPPPEPSAEAARRSIHGLLDRLQIGIRIVNPIFDVGDQVATGDRILSHPLTIGVEDFRYGLASQVTGGDPLFLSTARYPFAAAAYVPEPDTSHAAISAIAVLWKGSRSVVGNGRRKAKQKRSAG